MMDLLRQFGQVILYGPPGTGKTREAKRIALSMLSGDAPPTVATSGEIEELLKPFHQAKRYEIVVFHPAYEYEQFVGGIEPMVTAGGQLAFQVKAGVFLRLCRLAEQSRQSAVLLIDEINRGSLPKLLGELVHALEYRAPHSVTLPFICEGRSDLVVPTNLYIIATMNSSDQSIGHIDAAIRRRFALVHIGPNPDVVRRSWQQIAGWPNAESYGGQLARLMTDLNQALGGDDPTAEVELGVGHSYFLPNPGSARDAALLQVRMKWVSQVQPLLRQYAQVLNLGVDFFQQFRDLPTPPA
jgi:5-methylcytosine-specific restriction protein B